MNGLFLGNTKKRGIMQFFVYKEGTDYVGVCLNLDIVEYGIDKDVVMASIKEAAYSYVDAVRKEGLPDKMLNKPASDKHIRKWLSLVKLSNKTKSMKSDIKMYPAAFLYDQYCNSSVISA